MKNVAYEVFKLKNENQNIGMGSIGDLEKEMDEEEFISIQKKLNIEMIRHSKKMEKK